MFHVNCTIYIGYKVFFEKENKNMDLGAIYAVLYETKEDCFVLEFQK